MTTTPPFLKSGNSLITLKLLDFHPTLDLASHSPLLRS